MLEEEEEYDDGGPIDPIGPIVLPSCKCGRILEGRLRLCPLCEANLCLKFAIQERDSARKELKEALKEIKRLKSKKK